MPRRKGLTDKQVANLPKRDTRYAEPDPEMRGHYLRVPARSSRAPVAFAAVARNPSGKQIWKTVGTADAIGIERARELAREAIQQIKAGKPTTEPGKRTVKIVAEEWLEGHVKGNNLRSEYECRRIVNRYLIPEIGDRIFVEVRRPDIMAVLDRIAIERRPMAHAVEKIFSSMAAWVADRDEAYHSPLPRKSPYRLKGSRDRMLTDDEIRAIWSAPGQYGDFCRLALLTAQRREKLITLQWSDIHNGVWVISTAPREKGNAGKIRLPQAALDIIQRQPKMSGYVFAGRGSGPTAIFRSGTHKTQFDKVCGVRDWRIHDLRRTARSLVARAGVQTEIAERVLGHTQGKLIETYNRYAYFDEMADALTKLAELIKQITSSA
jgi:integrase